MFARIYRSLIAALALTALGATAIAQEPLDQDLVAAYQALSAGDQSVLAAAADRFAQDGATAQMMTSQGSANDRFWSQLVDRGWLARGEPPAEIPIPVAVYEITPAGRAPIARLVAAAKTAAAPSPSTFHLLSCGELFQTGRRSYKRDPREMIFLLSFAMSYQLAKTEDLGVTFAEVMNRRDVFPPTYRRCIDHPEDSFLTALSQTSPAHVAATYDETDVSDQRCGRMFDAQGFIPARNPLAIRRIAETALGYWAGKAPEGEAENLIDRLLDDNASLGRVVDRCAQAPDERFIDVVRRTPPL